MVHYFSHTTDTTQLPERFTYPFCYQPHPLCREAAEMVKHYLDMQYEWKDELSKGKMFGVLIVRDAQNQIGFLAAYSGILAHRNDHAYFVPPVFDLLSPDGYFKQEESRISDMNHQITALEHLPEFLGLQLQLNAKKEEAEGEIRQAKERYKRNKQLRDDKRSALSSETELAMLMKESQFEKAEIKRLEKRLKDDIKRFEEELLPYTIRINQLREMRKQHSADLQHWLFTQFTMLNAKGQSKSLREIFEPLAQRVPPGGAGECAGPKLLQYAYLNGLKPLAMAEFWWGDSPKTELRIHGNYYPACKGKCEPILGFMLQGLEVDPNPLECKSVNFIPDIVYEDEWLLVLNKPEGVLSVDGKISIPSVEAKMKEMYPEATGPMIVHRLDMATSGLLLIAKTKEVHQKLQAMFKSRDVKKRYTAILGGELAVGVGHISLPICLNPMDRPRQMVSYEHGKPADTYYEVLSVENGKTRIALYPLTGRTHQLRVHCAHRDGLNTPIVGDNLYGQPSDRLYLHAEYLAFAHPVSGEKIEIEAKAPF